MKQNLQAYIDDNFFDWYQVTFDPEIEPDKVIEHLLSSFDLVSVERTSPRVKQYARAVDIVRGSRVIAHVCWDGCNEGVHLIATGSIADDVANWLQCNYSGRYGVSRADVRIDFVESGAFDFLTNLAFEFAKERKIVTNHQGDWLTGERGRTLYIGSKSSVAQVRIYEKGKKEGGDPNWVRIEAQVRPSKRRGKLEASTLPALMFWQATKWLHDFRNLIFLDNRGRNVMTLGSVWSATDEQRALMALVKQYGNTLDNLANKLPNGWDGVGIYLKNFRSTLKENNNSVSGNNSCPYDEIDSIAVA